MNQKNIQCKLNKVCQRCGKSCKKIKCDGCNLSDLTIEKSIELGESQIRTATLEKEVNKLINEMLNFNKDNKHD